MYIDKPFRLAFLISLVAHSALVWQLPMGRGVSGTPEPPEITYVTTTMSAEQPQASRVEPREMRAVDAGFAQPAPMWPDMGSVELKRHPHGGSVMVSQTVVSPLDVEFMAPGPRDVIDLENLEQFQQQPLFLDYYRLIRQRIKRFAQMSPPLAFEPGEVYISFALQANGHLRDVELVPNQSTQQLALRSSALRAVRGAAPYPVFPPAFERSLIRFRIIISFQHPGA